MLVSFIVKFVLYLSLYCEKNENKQKEVGFDPFLIKKTNTFYVLQNSVIFESVRSTTFKL